MNPYVQYMYSYPHKTAYRPLEDVYLKEYIHFLKGSENSLYIHIPFCQAKCGYCNLFSVTGQDAQDMDRYLDAVKRQGIQYQQLLDSVQAVFCELVIGGGTPLSLLPGQLERMFGMAADLFAFTKDRQIVAETAPNQTDALRLQALKQAGVTRVSMGIQSFHDRELAVLGRRHCAQKAREALHLLKSSDFACVNTDFIYGIPGQTVNSLLESLKEALTFEPDEIFLYPLYVKHGVGMQYQGIRPDAEQTYLQYQAAGSFLKSEGYRQDSMRRFVRRKEEKTYVECGFGTSLALGCGGRSYLGNLHFCSPYAVTRQECLTRLHEYENTTDFTRISHGILLSQEELRRRYLIRHLFLMPGLSLEGYQKAFGSSVIADFPILQDWTDSGYITLQKKRSAEYLTLTEAGLGYSDHLGPQLISASVQTAMEEWEELYDRLPRQSEKL